MVVGAVYPIKLQEINRDNVSSVTVPPTDTRKTSTSKDVLLRSTTLIDFNIIVKKKITLFSAIEDRKIVIFNQKDLIEDHLQRRIQLFFQQAILCYGTPFIYEAEGAEDQIGKGHTRKDTQGIIYQTQAAHSSTFPCLYAYCKDAHGKKQADTKFAFLKGSHAYVQHNSTVELIDVVNKTDSLLDGKLNENKVRTIALEIINKLATKEYTPQIATIEFSRRFILQLKRGMDNSKESDLRKDVMQIYLRQTEYLLEAMNMPANTFDLLMGIKGIDEQHSLRKIVYQQRYQLIQDIQFTESKVFQRIKLAEEQIKESKFKRSLRALLLQKEKVSSAHLLMQQFFCTSEIPIDSITKQKNKVQCQAQYSVLIADLKRDLRALQRELLQHEPKYRAQLLKDLRCDYKQWRQIDFAEAYNAIFNNSTISRSKVSRWEATGRLLTKTEYKTPDNQRIIAIGLEMAKKIAQTFDIDEGIIVSSFVSELSVA